MATPKTILETANRISVILQTLAPHERAVVLQIVSSLVSNDLKQQEISLLAQQVANILTPMNRPVTVAAPADEHYQQ